MDAEWGKKDIISLNFSDWKTLRCMLLFKSSTIGIFAFTLDAVGGVVICIPLVRFTFASCPIVKTHSVRKSLQIMGIPQGFPGHHN